MPDTRGEITRKRILEAAGRLIKKKGLGATSIAELTKEAGVERGSLYFHFTSKDDLGLALMENTRAGFMEFLEDSLRGRTPGARLESFLRSVYRVHDEAGFVGGCVFGNTALELADTDPNYAGLVSRLFDDWAGRLSPVIREGQAAGEVSSALPARTLAVHMVSALEGGIMQARVKKDGRALKETLRCLRTLLGLTGPGSTRRRR